MWCTVSSDVIAKPTSDLAQTLLSLFLVKYNLKERNDACSIALF